ncbi:hypothetical protein [Halomicronema hongdechloris]|uniref:hypothetical protein n=1 Tax=Halomicronema hongdechloris TaxID=1209493 RepID=UPI0010CC60FA|nr:hypothetical protein [Halomicronema hongdechloris]
MGLGLIAVYGGVAGVILAAWRQQRRRDRNLLETGRAPDLLLLYGVGILLLRAMTELVVPSWGQLALAWGLLGGLLVGLAMAAEPPQQAFPLSLISPSLWGGRALMVGGWLLAVMPLSAQALVINGMGLGLRLWRWQSRWQRQDFVAIWLLGLQSLWLAWRLLPIDLRLALLTPLTRWSGAEATPWALLGILGYPYVVLTVAVADWAYRRRHSALVTLADGLAGFLNGGLLLLSLWNGGLLVLHLIATTVTATIASGRRRTGHPSRQYLIHGLILFTLAATVEHTWPGITLGQRLALALGLMVGEGIVSVGPVTPWRRGANYGTLALAGLSYSLWGSLLLQPGTQPLETLPGVVIPMVLTGLASRGPAQSLRLFTG